MSAPDSEKKTIVANILGFTMLACFAGVFLTLPQFVITLIQGNCQAEDNPIQFDTAEKDECAQITGVPFGAKSELVSAQIETTKNEIVILSLKDELEDATVTRYDSQFMIPTNTVPEDFIDLQKKLGDIQASARQLSLGQPYSTDELQSQLMQLNKHVQKLAERWPEDTQRITMLETSKEIGYNGPNPTASPLLDLNVEAYKPPALPKIQLIRPHMEPNGCSRAEEAVKKLQQIHLQLKDAYSSDPAKTVTYDDWPDLNDPRTLKCASEAIADLPRIAFWYELENRHQAIQKLVFGNEDLAVTTIKGRKVELPDAINGQEYALDLTQRPPDWWDFTLFPFCVIMLSITVVVARRMNSTEAAT